MQMIASLSLLSCSCSITAATLPCRSECSSLPISSVQYALTDPAAHSLDPCCNTSKLKEEALCEPGWCFSRSA